jgi:hypothetical protein
VPANGVQVNNDNLRAAVGTVFAGTNKALEPASTGLADTTNMKASGKAKRKRRVEGKDDVPPPTKRAKSRKDAAGGNVPKRKTKQPSTKARANKKKATAA